MTKTKRNKQHEKVLRSLLKEKPYFNCKENLADFQGRFNNLLQSNIRLKKYLDKLTTIIVKSVGKVAFFTSDYYLISLSKNLKNLQSSILVKLVFNFNIIGITETKTKDSNSESAEFSFPGYEFEFVPTPLAFGGVGMFIDETLHYTMLQKTSNEAFQALWIELSFVALIFNF